MATASAEESVIEVRGCAPSTTEETVLLYFENTRRSGGGDITKLDLQRGNKYVITFDDPKVVDRVLSRAHTLEDYNLTVTKHVDTIDSTKLLVKNLSDSTTLDGLTLFIENVSGTDVQDVDKDEDWRQAVVMFVKPIEVQKVLRNYESKPAKKKVLDGERIKICAVEVTPSILVDDLPTDVTQDWLELYFENTKKSGGGDIDSVVIDPNQNTAKITFTDPARVTGVLRRSHTWQGHSLRVSAFYEYMQDSESEVEEEDMKPSLEKSPPRPQFQHRQESSTKETAAPPTKRTRSKPEYTVPVEADILHFIEGDRISRDEFRDVMKLVNATVIRDIGGNTIRVQCSQDSLRHAEKEKWEVRSQETLVEYLAQYCRKEVTIIKEIWTPVVSELEETPQNLMKVSKDVTSSTVVLTGRVSSVEKAAEKVDEATKTYLAKLERDARMKTSKIKHQSRGKLAVLQHELDGVRKSNPSVEIQINWKSNEVVFTGCDEDMSIAMCSVYEEFNTFINRRYRMKKCLMSFLEGKKGKQKMREMLKRQSLHVGVDLEESDVNIIGKSENDVKSAHTIIDKHFKVDEVRNKSDITAVLEKEDFLNLVAMLQETSVVEINFDPKAVIVAGLNKDVETAKNKLHDYIMANIKTTKFLSFDESIMRYVKHHKTDDGVIADVRGKLYGIKGKLEVKKTGFYLEGNPDALSEAEREIKKLVSTVDRKKRQIRFQNRGQCKFFIGGRGEDLTRGIENKVPCAIEVNKKGSFAEHKDRHTLAAAAKPISMSYPDHFVKHGKRISVKQGDLAAEKVDVIVNSVSSDLEKPFAGGISKALLKRAGDSLLQNTQALGSLNVGDVHSTDSGKLKSQKVYHCVLDKWSGGKGNDILRTVMKGALYKASKAGFSSIAFPSLGTGFLGFPHHKAAEIMFQEVLSFAKKNPQSNLKDIRFVVFDHDSVDAFKRESGNIQSIDHVAPSQSQSTGASQHTHVEVTHSKIGNVTVDIKQGDLTKERVDAIINPVISNFDQGQVGHAIINAGGNDIARDYDSQKFNLDKGPIITGAGKLRNINNVIHMICPDNRSLALAVEGCLSLADSCLLNSVAVPAIGTGHFGLSVRESADGIIEGVKRFTRSNPQTLSNVNVILFQAGMVSEFARTLGEATNRKGPPRAGQSAQGNGQSTHEKIGNMTLDIKQGDLTRQRVDCLINPVIDNLDHGQVGNAIIKAGGNDIDSDYQREKHRLKKGPIITGAGDLRNVKTIIHLVCPDARSLAREVDACLQLANTRNMTSIAFPAIGTGYYGLSADESANGIIEGVKSFSRSTPQSLKYVVVVLYQANMLPDFSRKLAELTSRRGPVKATPASQSHGRPEVVVTIYGDNDNDLRRAESEIRKIVSEEVIDAVIKDDLISKLDKSDVKRLEHKGSQLHVEVTVEKQSQGAVKDALSLTPFMDAKKVLHLQGLKSDVEKFKTMIHSWLEKFSAAKEKQKTVKWYFMDGKSKREFEAMWNYEIEMARLNGQNELNLLAEDGSRLFKVDLKAMMETNLKTKKKCRIERDGPEDTAIIYPRSWDPFPTKHSPSDPYLVSLKKGTTEYDRVEKSFQGSSGPFNPTIMKIERIQQKSQFTFYFMRKKEMDRKYPGDQNERHLYHGTKKDSVRLICKSGFNRSYAGSAVGAREGLGVYFAVQSGYSLKPYYSPADGNGDRFIFRVRVLVGKFAKGSAEMKEPPFLDAAKGDRYDTTTDDIKSPNMFVTFHDEQAYPEYLITFR
ncbi:protein mono-ADP-ribosyltransferase PARP14-like [Glandiceps talaboti]